MDDHVANPTSIAGTIVLSDHLATRLSMAQQEQRQREREGRDRDKDTGQMIHLMDDVWTCDNNMDWSPTCLTPTKRVHENVKKRKKNISPRACSPTNIDMDVDSIPHDPSVPSTASIAINPLSPIAQSSLRAPSLASLYAALYSSSSTSSSSSSSSSSNGGTSATSSSTKQTAEQKRAQNLKEAEELYCQIFEAWTE